MRPAIEVSRAWRRLGNAQVLQLTVEVSAFAARVAACRQPLSERWWEFWNESEVRVGNKVGPKATPRSAYRPDPEGNRVADRMSDAEKRNERGLAASWERARVGTPARDFV